MAEGAPRPLWADAPPIETLPRKEMHVFAFTVDLPAPRVGELEALLAADELRRANRFRRAGDRDRYIVGRGQTRTILGAFLGKAPDALHLVYGEHGKPALTGGRHEARVRFNMSRSHALGVLAIQLDEDVGVDVERVRSFPDAVAIAMRFFAPAEHDALRALPPEKVDAAFFSYWARKEAVIKSSGAGLAQSMDTFVLRPEPGWAVEPVTIAGAAPAAARWCRLLPPPAPGYVAAIAGTGRVRPLNRWAWTGVSGSHR
jgi:4'-phosphopantetheinyl transferase